MNERTDAQQSPRSSLGALTGLRFFAALWVVMYHYALELRFTSLLEEGAYRFGHHNIVDFLILQGHLAVDIFFILSGFILAYTYTTATNTLRGGPRAFWIARLARIYPVYLIGLVLCIWGVLSAQPSVSDIATSGVAHVLLIQNWFPVMLEWNQPGWSLSVEAFFYALFPLLLPLLARQRQRMLWLTILFSLLIFSAVILALSIANAQPTIAALPGWRNIARYSPLISLPEFTAGMALGLLFIRRRQSDAASTTTPTSQRSGLKADIQAVSVIFALVVVLVALYKLGMPTIVVDAQAPFVLPLIGMLIFVLAFQRGIVARFLSRSVIVWLGEISYGIYLLHVPIWELLLIAAQWFSIGPGHIILVPIYAVLLLTAAGLSFKYIERPARKAIRARLAKAERIPVPVPTVA